MKSRRPFLFLITTVFSLVLSGCNGSNASSYASSSSDEPPIIEYTVVFDSQGGSEIPSVKVKRGETIAKPTDPVKGDDTFTGWYREQALTNKFDFETPIYTDLTLFAGWQETKYTVTFDSQGGSGVAPITVKKGQTIDKPKDPIKMHGNFTGWYKEQELANLFDFSNPINQDITLYAGWNESSYNINLKIAVFADIQLCAKENSNPYGSYYANAGNTVHAYISLKNHFQLCKEQNVDVILMNGDIVNNAITYYYDLYESALESVYGNDESLYPQIIYNMGNHEWWNLSEQVVDNSVSLFKQHARIGAVSKQTTVKFSLDTEQTLPTYYKVISGVPFLVISGEDPSGHIGNTMKSEIQSWLTEMSELPSVVAGGPIYVLYHCALHTTLTHGNGAFADATVLEELLQNYPQAVVFTGDTHYSGVNERAINQVDFTCINIGSSSYSRMDKMSATMTGSEHFYNMKIKGGKTSDELLGDAGYKHEYTPTIHIMNAYDDYETSIDRYFSTEDAEHPIHINKTWDIPRFRDKSYFAYTNERFKNVESAKELYGAEGVSWSSNASLRFGVKNGKMTVIIPDTNQYHFTEHYKIEVTGNTSRTYDVVGNYYTYNSEPGKMYFFLEDLPAGDSYSIKVTAYDYFDNPSLNYLTASVNDVNVCADEKDNQFTNTYYELSCHLNYDDHAPGDGNTSLEYYYNGVKQNEWGAPLGQLIRDVVPGKTSGGESISQYLSIGSQEKCEVILKAKIKNLSSYPLRVGYTLYGADYTYKNVPFSTTEQRTIPGNSDWTDVEFNITSLYPEVVGRSGVTFLALIASAYYGAGFNAEGYEMHLLLDEMDVVAGDYADIPEQATRNNLEMCTYSGGQWRGEGSVAEVTFVDTYGPTSTSARKITFANSNNLPETNDPSSTATVCASFDLAQTAGLGTSNDIDAKNCTLSFDIKMSEEFFNSGNNSRCKFTFKVEDEHWKGRIAWLNLVNNVSDYDISKTDNGWLHVEQDLSTHEEYSVPGSYPAGEITYAVTFGFFGISQETRSTAYIVLDNVALIANP